MLILPAKEKLKLEHEQTKQGLIDQFNSQLERILNANQHLDKYWILGKVRFLEEFGGQVGRTFLEACEQKPPLVKDAFLYEVDNRKGCKTLLWVSNKDQLRFPTLGKTLSVSKKGRKT